MTRSQSSERSHVSPPTTVPVFAAGAMLLWVGVEFLLRRGVVLLADPLGSLLGADMVAILVGFPLLAAGIAWWGTRRGVDPADWDYELSLRAVGAGVAGAVGAFALYAALAYVYTTILGMEPTVGASALGTGSEAAWALGLLLVVNGVLVPITEELAWRGAVQTALAESYGTWLAVVVTAAAFVLKHLVVDLAAPPLRVTSLVVFAVLFCVLRARYGTASSTAAHLVVNGLATASLVLA